MKILIILGSVFTPILMLLMQKYWIKWRILLNVVSILSAFIIGNIAALSIYEIIKDNTVFMTNIHAIFLNPFFLITGSYLGVYFLYRLILVALKEI
ncbi:MAG: transposase [Paenibacillaceae bacterium]